LLEFQQSGVTRHAATSTFLEVFAFFVFFVFFVVQSLDLAALELPKSPKHRERHGMTAAALYTQMVLEHQRAPRNFGALEPHTHAADGVNPLCGDALRVELRREDGRVAAMRFSGEACAVAIAAASMLSELAVGRSEAQLAEIEARFGQLIRGEVERDAMLADLNALAALARHPARRKCALLAFATLRAALAGRPATTTEGSSE
jgi:nitrogen fixation protein NifU and related proteins